ncbi:hypothetical protein DIPPA_34168 [Diplonema papillatum]|nr:hypothetical protein DIPPA_34168 [Diplonema papillatum]
MITADAVTVSRKLLCLACLLVYATFILLFWLKLFDLLGSSPSLSFFTSVFILATAVFVCVVDQRDIEGNRLYRRLARAAYTANFAVLFCWWVFSTCGLLFDRENEPNDRKTIPVGLVVITNAMTAFALGTACYGILNLPWLCASRWVVSVDSDDEDEEADELSDSPWGAPGHV